MRNYNFTSTNYWGYGSTADKTGLYITKPVAIETILDYIPNLKAVCFDFSSGGFTKNPLDQFDYIQEFFTLFKSKYVNLKHVSKFYQIEYLEISNADDLTVLPDIITQLPLKEVRFNHCLNLNDLSILSEIKTLEGVHILGGQVKFGAAFYQLPKLNRIHFSNVEVEDIQYVSTVKQLEYIEFILLKISQLPEGIEDLTALKYLKLNRLTQLEKLPNFEKLQELEQLELGILPKVAEIPDTFDAAQDLKKVLIYGVGTDYEQLEFPASICKNQNLRELRVEACPIDSFPDVFPVEAKLNVLYLKNLDIAWLPHSFENLQILEQLQIISCDQLTHIKEVGGLMILKQLVLSYLSGLTKLGFHFSELIYLEYLSFDNLPNLSELTNFSERHLSLSIIKISEAPKIKSIPTSIYHCKGLKNMMLNQVGIEALPAILTKLPKLNSVSITNCDALAYIPSKLFTLGEERFILAAKQIQDSQLFDIQNLIKYIKEKVSPHLHQALAYCLFNNYGKEPLTNDIKKNLMEALALPNSDLRLLLFKSLSQLNPNGIELKGCQIKAGDTVSIIGTTQNKRTILRQELEALGFKYSTKINNKVNYILVAKKPKISANFWDKDRILFSENEFMDFQKEHNPGLLQQEETSDDFIHNLRQLLWSNDPANEAVALELVINNGLPDGVDMDFIVVAKTSVDKKLRAKIRKFLKGNLSEGALKVLNDRTVIDKKHAPFYRFHQFITGAQIAQLALALYQRRGLFLHSFFQYDEGHSPYRKEMFKHVLPSLLEKAKYIKFVPGLREEEVNEVLEHPVFEGQLKRIVLHSHLIKSIPNSIFKHQSLNNIEIHGAFESKTLTPELFKLTKLTKLMLNWPTLETIPTEIAQLKGLKELILHTEQAVELPTSFKTLTKITRVYVSRGLVDREKWLTEMPDCVF